jgi:hypothetical protein
MQQDLKQTVQELTKVLRTIPEALISKEGFGTQVVDIIKSSFELDNLVGIKVWLEDHIDFLESEVKYTKKYSGTVYHLNVHRSKEAELRMSRYILQQISLLH